MDEYPLAPQILLTIVLASGIAVEAQTRYRIRGVIPLPLGCNSKRKRWF
jgi:hypothetical protein